MKATSLILNKGFSFINAEGEIGIVKESKVLLLILTIKIVLDLYSDKIIYVLTVPKKALALKEYRRLRYFNIFMEDLSRHGNDFIRGFLEI